MTPTQLAAVRRKLITMETSVHKVSSHAAAGLDRARGAPGIHVAVERNLWLLDDLARDVSLLVACMPAHRGDRHGGAPFEAAVACGALGPSMVRRLSPNAGPHHLQMQFCMDTDPHLIPSLLDDAVSAYRDFVEQISGWVARPAANASPNAEQPPTTSEGH